jgi:hypothetical protein
MGRLALFKNRAAVVPEDGGNVDARRLLNSRGSKKGACLMSSAKNVSEQRTSVNRFDGVDQFTAMQTCGGVAPIYRPDGTMVTCTGRVIGWPPLRIPTFPTRLPRL